MNNSRMRIVSGTGSNKMLEIAVQKEEHGAIENHNACADAKASRILLSTLTFRDTTWNDLLVNQHCGKKTKKSPWSWR
jgi:hypothetical protein